MYKTIKTCALSLLLFAGMQAVQAQPTTAAPTPTQDAADVVSLFSDHYTTTGRGPEPQTWGGDTEVTQTVIYGTEGVMRIYDDPAHSIELDLRSGETEYYDVEAIQTNDNQTASGIIDAFVECLENDTEPAIPAASVLPAMRAVFGSMESSKTGTTIKLS